jgi:hypothetical protein
VFIHPFREGSVILEGVNKYFTVMWFFKFFASFLFFLVGNFCYKFLKCFVNRSLSRDFQSYTPGLYQEGDHVRAVNTCYPKTSQRNKRRTTLNEQRVFVWNWWCGKSLCVIVLPKFSPRLLRLIRASRNTGKSKIFRPTIETLGITRFYHSMHYSVPGYSR